MAAASRTARLIVRMSGICEPMWKWSSLNADSIFASRRISIASRISAVDRPNFACSPPEVAHLPAPFGKQADAHPDPRLDVHLRGDLRDGAHLGELLGDEDDFLAELAAEHRHADEGVSL